MNAPDVTPTILTVGGRYFPLLNPQVTDIYITDIAHALSHLCRFAGHTRNFYSVAQHSMLVSSLVPEEDALVALLHDASEAYLVDIPSPLKRQLSDYAAIEARVMSVVLSAFDLLTEIPASVKHADLVALATEQRDLLPPHDDTWAVLSGITPAAATIHPLPPGEAAYGLLARFHHLMARRA